MKINFKSIEYLIERHTLPYYKKVLQSLISNSDENEFDPTWLGMAIALVTHDNQAFLKQLNKYQIQSFENLDSILKLFKTFDQATYNGLTIWHFLAWSGRAEILFKAIEQKLCEPSTMINENEASIWHYLAQSGNADAIFKAIDENQFDPTMHVDMDGETIWHYLALSGNIEALFKAIDQKRFDPNTTTNRLGSSVWHYLAQSGNADAIFKAIQEKRFVPVSHLDHDALSIWHFLALSGNADALFKAIEEKQFDPLSHKDVYGNSVWHYLAWSGNIEALFKAIDQKQFDPDTHKNTNGDTIWVYFAKKVKDKESWLRCIRSGHLSSQINNKSVIEFFKEQGIFNIPEDLPYIHQMMSEYISNPHQKTPLIQKANNQQKNRHTPVSLMAHSMLIVASNNDENNQPIIPNELKEKIGYLKSHLQQLKENSTPNNDTQLVKPTRLVKPNSSP